MKFSTTIKRKYWEEKLDSVKQKGYFYEYKADTPFWHKRLSKLQDNLPAEGVFLIGSEVKRVVITEILRSLACYIPEKYESMFNTEYVWILKCWLVGGGNGKEEAEKEA